MPDERNEWPELAGIYIRESVKGLLTLTGVMVLTLICATLINGVAIDFLYQRCH